MKGKFKFILLASFFAMVLFVGRSYFMRDTKADNLIRQGNELVKKIETYKKENGRLPNSMSDVGIDEKEDSPLHYEKKDSVNYIISFGTSLGESKIYYSDSKKWEEFYR